MWLREDGTPYYVGKGSGWRAYNKHKWHGNPPPKGRMIFYISIDESEAFENEIALIWYYGRTDLGTGILRNMTDGGENPPKSRKGRRGCPSTRKGLKLPPRSEEVCSKISKTMSELLRKDSGHRKGRTPWNKGLKGAQSAWNKGTKGLPLGRKKGYKKKAQENKNVNA
jgi:hypothetical protein